jgi:4-aminobutyrate aminotransferase/(S)-3-amino-2-methylpropionate transaminase
MSEMGSRDEGRVVQSDRELGECLPRLVTPVPGPESHALARRLSLSESQNVTLLADDFPVFWEAAKGANVRDADGNVFLDLTSAFGVASVGHAHPKIVEAIRRQSGRLIHGMGDVHPPVLKVELLERLGALLPWKSARGVLASSGSEAVEIALKTAQLATGRRGVVAFQGSYHGLTLGSLSVTERTDFRRPFEGRLAGGVAFVPFPDPILDGEAAARLSLEALDRALALAEERVDPVGCVIVEPIQGRGGVRIPPPGFHSEVARRARAAGALFVLDEVFTGFGRTGTLFDFEQEGVVPDLLCVGKALGGGLPMSACLGPEEIMAAWPPSKGEAIHTSTFLGHPLACASALAFLDVLEEEGLVARSREEGRWLLGALSEALRGGEGIRDVRGRGLFLGVEFVENGEGERIATAALQRGLLLLPSSEFGEVVELAPPFVTTREQMEWAVGVLGELAGR